MRYDVAFLLAAAVAAFSSAPAQAVTRQSIGTAGASRLDGTVTPRVPVRPGGRPNILFVIMDDVGIDQMRDFGYGGATPPSTPSIDTIARGGVRFHNTWSMPACTTSRAVIFEARFPFRTNVFGALGPNDLANSMVNPFEMTTPKLLATRGYESGLFGKFHLGLQGHDPAGYAMPHNLGWSYYAGWLDETGDPSSIDQTAGGVAPDGVSYTCGFVPSSSVAGGADAGACYQADGSCEELTTVGVVPPGRICRDRGGILVPNAGCQVPPPDELDFQTLSGHYVSPLVYNFPDGTVVQVPPTDPRARTFRAKNVVDEAIAWINQRPTDKPWMATVSFASDHTPLMQPPVDEAQHGNAQSSDFDCSDAGDQRVISDLMIESLDTEVGRLLVETGIATRGKGGRLIYRPERSNVMIVVVGDNGSLGNTVKLPFQIARAKGTAYQTGVWVPLLVAGPLVTGKDRVVSHMVNIADLYALFGEIAGIEDVRREVPRPIDAEPMLPYLLDPEQPEIRKWNFAQIGVNLQANGTINQPCLIADTCTQIPVSQSVCEDNLGVWFGEGHSAPIADDVPPEGFDYCCQVKSYLVQQGVCVTPDCAGIIITPLNAVAIRNQSYKIVQNTVNQYVSQAEPCVETTSTQFYEINENVPFPRLDYFGTDFPLDHLTPVQQQNYDQLSEELEKLLASQKPCPGDGNIDYVVDQKDLEDWSHYAETTGLSSWYDINTDGLTNEEDAEIIQANLGLDCRNVP